MMRAALVALLLAVAQVVQIPDKPLAPPGGGEWNWGSLAPGLTYAVEVVVENRCKTPERVGITYWTSPGSLDPHLPDSIVVPAESSRTVRGEFTVAPGLTGDIRGELFLHYYSRSAPPACHGRTIGYQIVGRVRTPEDAVRDIDGTIAMLRYEIEKLWVELSSLGGFHLGARSVDEAPFLLDDVKRLEDRISYLNAVAADIEEAKIVPALDVLKKTVAGLRNVVEEAAASGPAPVSDSYYNDALGGLRDGRDLAHRAEDALAEGNNGQAAETAKQALGELADAERDLADGVRDGTIGKETERALQQFIDEAKADAQSVLDATSSGTATISIGPLFKKFDPPVPVPPSDNDDPRDEPPPVVTGEELGTAWVTKGLFQPVQGVWQEDSHFKDFTGKQLTRLSPTTARAELPMVLERPTLVFGPLEELYDRIFFKGLSTATVYVPLKLRITLRQAGGEKIVYEERRATHNVPLEGPSRPPVEWVASIDTKLGVPVASNFQPFTFIEAGDYELIAELVRGDGSATGLRLAVRGTVVEVPRLRVQFAPITYRQIANFDAYSQWAQGLAAASERWIPRVFPLPANGLTASLSPTEVIIDPPGPDPLQKIADLFSGVSADERKRLMRFARLEERLGAQAALSGADRAVALMTEESFGDVYPERPLPRGVALGERVIIVKMGARAETVAHELAHTFPYLWSETQMKQLFGFSYHNDDDPGVGNGFEIGPHRTRHNSVAALMSGKPFRWIEQGTYWNLVHAMRGRSAPAPTVSGTAAAQEKMVVRGYVARAGGRIAGRLEPGATASAEQPPSVPAASDWHIVQRDAAGQELKRDPIPVTWRPPEMKAERPVVAFVRVVERAAAARQIELVGPRDEVVDRRTVSRAAPTVRLVTPAANASLPAARTVRVEWEARDADGDPLTASVLYSADGGETWRTVSLDQSASTFDLPIVGRPRNARVRVVVSDGVRGATAETAFGFVPR